MTKQADKDKEAPNSLQGSAAAESFSGWSDIKDQFEGDDDSLPKEENESPHQVEVPETEQDIDLTVARGLAQENRDAQLAELMNMDPIKRSEYFDQTYFDALAEIVPGLIDTESHRVNDPPSTPLPPIIPNPLKLADTNFLIRTFLRRLRIGIVVIKHPRNPYSPSCLRKIHLLHNEQIPTLTWIPAEGERPSRKQPPKLPLWSCTEVRHAWSLDPLSQDQAATPIIRRKCRPIDTAKSFSLIFPGRTVDVTALTADQAKIMIQGFAALTYRLRLSAPEQEEEKKSMLCVPRRPKKLLTCDTSDEALTSSASISNISATEVVNVGA